MTVIILFCKRQLNLKYFIGYTLALFLTALVSTYQFGFCIRDYDFAKNNTFVEETLTVIEFTKVERDLDGNGQISYSKPKFYIHEKDEYIILHTKDVEIGKTYRVRYYPNTKIIGRVVDPPDCLFLFVPLVLRIVAKDSSIGIKYL